MLRIDRQKKNFNCLSTPTFTDAFISERRDLQEYIWNSPDAFFREIKQELFLIGKEVLPSDDVQDRIDILALDKEGYAVIIELKRGNNKLQMLQAISYAGMISKWTADDFRDELNKLDPQRWEQLDDFLDGEKEEINRHQRIILIAEAFDISVLSGAEWLAEQFGVNILCCQLALAQDAVTKAEFLVCSNVFPAPEITRQALPRGRARGVIRKAKWSDWDTALASIENQAIRSFFKKEVDSGREAYLRKRTLYYRIGGKRRWALKGRQDRAYVWQGSRFSGDQDFWRASLSIPEEVDPVKEGRGLRFYLSTSQDCEFFRKAATETLTGMTWERPPDDGEEVEDEGEDGQV